MGVRDLKEEQGFNDEMELESEDINKRYLHGSAEIPEWRERANPNEEYQNFPEEKIWSPRDEVNEWVSFYVFMARSMLTFVQESQGISNREAMENSCTGYAEQYITDVLHDSEYIPEVALRTLLTKALPQKLVTRWTAADMELFVKGIARYGKNFPAIQRDLIPHKDTKDIVDFYYAWKWSRSAKELRTSSRRRQGRTKRWFSSIGHIFNEFMSPKIMTRSASAASRNYQSDATKAFKDSTYMTKRRRKLSSIGR